MGHNPLGPMDILRQLEDLKNMIDSPKEFLGLVWGLDRDEIGMQISKIRASLPQELKNAASTMRESDRIMEEARADAATLLENARKEVERIHVEARMEAERAIEQARLEQSRMLADSEILKLSKAQSEEIRAAADREALNMRRGAEKYAYDVLAQLEGVVGKAMTTIERGKNDLAPDKAALPAAREKARV
jgi:cell division septum initiation protein DivIVA